MPLRKVPLWTWWSLGIVAISLPWVGFTTRPQWDRFHPIPFTDPEDSLRDLTLNIAVFVPFGFWFAGGRERRSLASTLAAAALVSLTAEAPQLFSTNRNPSATDVVSALTGSAIGAGVRRLAPPRRAP